MSGAPAPTTPPRRVGEVDPRHRPRRTASPRTGTATPGRAAAQAPPAGGTATRADTRTGAPGRTAAAGGRSPSPARGPAAAQARGAAARADGRTGASGRAATVGRPAPPAGGATRRTDTRTGTRTDAPARTAATGRSASSARGRTTSTAGGSRSAVAGTGHAQRGAEAAGTRRPGATAKAAAAARRQLAARPQTTKVRTAPVLRLVAGHTPQAPKTPFVLLVLGLLGAGLVTLLLLNSAAAADAFTQGRLQRETRALALREQELGREVAALEAPGVLAERARRLGLVQSGDPGFLVLDPRGSAKVVGSPVAATAPPPPPKPTPTPTAARPTATPSASARPSPRTTARPTAGQPGTSASTSRPAPRPTPTPGGDR